VLEQQQVVVEEEEEEEKGTMVLAPRKSLPSQCIARRTLLVAVIPLREGGKEGGREGGREGGSMSHDVDDVMTMNQMGLYVYM